MWITDKIEKNWTKIFPLFYEKIVRIWLIEKFDLIDLDIIQPRIYYYQQKILTNFQGSILLADVIADYNEAVKFGKKIHSEIKGGANKRERYFCADGFYLDKSGKRILMEAKSWIPPHTTDGRLVNNPHALYFSLVDRVVAGGELEEIDKFILVYWSAETDGSGKRKGKGQQFHEEGIKIHDELINQWKEIRPGKEFEIIYLIDILEDLIKRQPNWYKEIITRERTECGALFDWLLGEDE